MNPFNRLVRAHRVLLSLGLTWLGDSATRPLGHLPYGQDTEELEPNDGKLSRSVLRGEGSRKAPDLPDRQCFSSFWNRRSPGIRAKG